MADPPWTPPPSGHRALADRLADTEVEPDSETVIHRRTAPPAPPRGSSRTWLVVAIAVASLAVVAASGASYVAYDNKNRADDWEARAFRLERNTEQLNGLLVERSTQLNERTSELNKLARTVERQQSALTRSESDVESLTRRQQQLAAEKAAVEDERATLQLQASTLDVVASAFVDCKDGLVQLLNYVLAEDFASAGAIVDGVSSDCDLAEASLSDYRARYG
jgi:TolA-binding protein